MVKVLVTGASGQAGLCLQSIANTFTEVQFDFLNSEQLDITNQIEVEEIFKAYMPDYCINFAAYTAVDKAEDEIELAYNVNAEGAKNIAEACKKDGVRLLHLSTDFVFDGQKKTPYTVTDATNPINVYGASKLKGEEYIQEVMEEYFIVRTSWLYSDFGNNFKKTILRLAGTKNEINVVNDQIGRPTEAVDLCVFLMQLIISNTMPFGIYHFSGDKICSWYDFAVSIVEEANLSMQVHPISSAEYPSKAKRPKYSVLG